MAYRTSKSDVVDRSAQDVYIGYMDLKTASPSEIDTQIAAYNAEIGEQHTIIVRAERVIENTGYYPASEREAAEKKIPAAHQAIVGIREKMYPLLDRYAAERWSRFYLVRNVNGHVHSSTNCPTCFIDTDFGWLTDCSGMTEDEIVTEFGEKVCTVCFPSAPANPQHRAPGRRDRATLDAKAAEKAAKLAAKLEKAILPDGSKMRLKGWDSPSTLIGAKRALLSNVESLRWYGVDHPSAPEWIADIDTLAEAIAIKTHDTVEEVLRVAEEKVAKKIAKERT